MTCPKCQRALEPVVHDGVEVDRCLGCHGIWFDSHELERLVRKPGSESIDRAQTEDVAVDPPARLLCPRCTTQLIRMADREQPHIHYEGCVICGGLFLDAGEFRDVKELTLLDWIRDLRTRTPTRS